MELGRSGPDAAPANPAAPASDDAPPAPSKVPPADSDPGLLANRWKGKETRRRRPFDWLRKLAAVLLVLSSVTVGIIGLMLVTSGTWWGILLILVTPIGIWTATRVTPEGGTTGYLDRNV